MKKPEIIINLSVYGVMRNKNMMNKDFEKHINGILKELDYKNVNIIIQIPKFRPWRLSSQL